MSHCIQVCPFLEKYLKEFKTIQKLSRMKLNLLFALCMIVAQE